MNWNINWDIIENIVANNIFNTIVSLVLGALISIKVIEERKRKEKRKSLLHVLRYELTKYPKKDISQSQYFWFLPGRKALIYNVLTSDILHPKKDNQLIIELYELLSWIENYDAVAQLNNISLIVSSQTIEHLTAMSYHYNKKMQEQGRKVLEMLKNYK
ncbi:hypothetical protein [Paenibacillus alkalitolerans]|uniref:hypothetical protein n=1 Tax=Paenibacillus alkalitolerans TaxID=2799335 RepID=UPI0018F3CC1C|nr:hypothetical protein [Paenibacillus alkalitolerans]